MDIDRLIIGRVMAVFAYLPRDSLHGPDLLQKLQRIERALYGDWPGWKNTTRKSARY